MRKYPSGKIIKMLHGSFVFEEKTLFDFQYDCYAKLPGSLNKKELKRTKMILDTMMVQTLNHANIISDLIAKFYERTAKKL
ncbi:MAG: hypothetical protein Q7R84_03445 [bacterium]|nr:hypothetical protein [bacterium]